MDPVELVNKYGFPIVAAGGMGYFIYYVWTYSDAGIEKRMPWYSDPDVYAPTQAIITTTHNDGDSWFGTLVANNEGWPPAPWIGGGNTSGSVSVDTSKPSVIWMWVR